MGYKDVVQAGIELLNSEKPGWRNLVDLNTLRLESCDVCVLGQVFGSFDNGLEELGIDSYESKDYGFNTDYSMQELTQAWKDALGVDNKLVEKGNVYQDKSKCCTVRIVSSHIVDIGTEKVTVYVYESGNLTAAGAFKAYSGVSDNLSLAQKGTFEPGGTYSERVDPPFVFKKGQFVTNDTGQVWYVEGRFTARPVKDQAYSVETSEISRKGLHEVVLPNGTLFSSTVK